MDSEDAIFQAAIAELDGLEREDLWDAKVGAEQASEPESPAPSGQEPEPFDPQLADQFEELLAAQAREAMLRGAAERAAEEERRARLRPVRVGDTPLDGIDAPALARPRAAELRDLEHGKRTVDRRVDLHGRTVAEALSRLRTELAHARDRGQRYLLVVTGRGKRSVAGPRIRPAVQDLLTREGREHVLWFQPAPPRLGGAGAFLVRLRRPGA